MTAIDAGRSGWDKVLVPFAGPFVLAACFVYTFGFVIQSAWRTANDDSDDEPPAVEPVELVEPVAPVE